jgi:hypothetical protein
MHRLVALSSTDSIYFIRKGDIVAVHFVRIDSYDRTWMRFAVSLDAPAL